MGEGSSRCPLKPSPTLQLGHSFRNELAIIYASCVAPTYLHNYNICKSEMSCWYINAVIRKQKNVDSF